MKVEREIKQNIEIKLKYLKGEINSQIRTETDKLSQDIGEQRAYLHQLHDEIDGQARKSKKIDE